MTAQICPNCGEENPARFRLCGYCGTALAPAAPPSQVRKIVTLVFVDLKGSTNLGEQLDPEAMHEVKDRYFTAMAAEITRHGGKIEKYVGDAIMAVFGLPRAHENDALRAIRAAVGMQTALVSLNEELDQAYGVRLANRTGINTGEVVANADPGADQQLVTGDAVNLAARLEQAAPENQILIGELTYGLVRDAVEAEPVEPLTLKGKSQPVAAYRIVSVSDRAVEGVARRDDAPMVGRELELERLRSAFAAAVEGPATQLMTVIGDAGVGKSRLIREFVGSLGDGAEILRGRCLPYGEGITFWPLVEIARAAAGIRDDDSQEAARKKLLGLVGERDVAARVASMIGLAAGQFPMPELFWGARRAMELLATRRPLVVVIDDIHWAEPAFLDLLEHLLDASSGVPILLLCSARHDLLDAHPDWANRSAAGRIVLESLSDEDAAQIVENLLGRSGLAESVRLRIVTAAEGNPLFVEQMLSMLVDSGAIRQEEGRWVQADASTELVVPPTIQALIAARLDQLGRAERSVVDPASVIGLQFEASAVADLVQDERDAVPVRLEAVAAKRIIRPSTEAEEEAYRFGHILIRDAAYQGLLKRARATLHEQFVGWADRVNAARGRALEFEEILGFHLEQAYLYLAELGPIDDHGRALGSDASRRLASAGRRASARGDMHAAANLLRRATAVLPQLDGDRLWLLPDLSEALLELGEFDAARATLDETTRAADELFDDRLAAHGELLRLLVDYYSGTGDGWSQRVLDTTERAIPVFQRTDDHSGQARAWRLRTALYSNACRYGDAETAAGRVLDEARAANDRRLESRAMSGYSIAALLGPMPVVDAINRCEEMLAAVRGDRRTEGLILGVLAQLYAMDGSFDRARETYVTARTTLEQLGPNVLAAATSTNSWRVEMLAGDPEAAEQELRRDFQALERMGEEHLRSTVAGALAHLRLAMGDDETAETFSRTAQELAADDDVESQAFWRGARAIVLARRGEAAEAERLAMEALALVRPTQAPIMVSDALLDAAEVLTVMGRNLEASALIAEAIEILEAKGDRVTAARLRYAPHELIGKQAALQPGESWLPAAAASTAG